MRQNRIIRIYRDRELLFEKVKIADTFGAKLRGLMFYPDLPGIDGLLLYPCKSVHMFWMRFPLDLIYLSKEREVIYLTEILVPNKFGPWVRNAYYVLETGAGVISAKHIRTGAQLRW